MTGPGPDIDTALSGDGPIPSEQVLSWIDAAADGKRKEHMELLATVPLLIIDDLGMRKLGSTAAEELLEIVMPLRTRQHAAHL